MENFKDVLSKLERHVQRITSIRPIYGIMIPFYEKLLFAQIKMQTMLNIKIPDIQEDLIRTKLEAGFSLLNRWDFPIDTEYAREMLNKIGEIIPRENRELSLSYEALIQILKDNQENKTFWRNILEGKDEKLETWANKTKRPMEQIRFLGIESLKPSLLLVGERLSSKVPHNIPWRKTYCPICGSLPAILLLKGKEGKRFGVCSWCGTEWQTNRIECLYCQNQLQESLGYLTIQNDEIYRIEYCNICKHYFKTIDCRSLEDDPIPSLEDLTTLHLDMIAQKKGYLVTPSLSPVIYSEFFKNTE